MGAQHAGTGDSGRPAVQLVGRIRCDSRVRLWARRCVNAGGRVRNAVKYSVDRARREKYEADMAQLKLLEQQGDLVRVIEVRAR